MKGLTKRQQQLLDFIVSFREARGMSPTWREMMVHLGISGLNGVRVHLEALVRKGYLAKTRFTGRTTVPVPQAPGSPHWYRVVRGFSERDGIRQGDYLQIDPAATFTTSYPAVYAVDGSLYLRSPHHQGLIALEALRPEGQQANGVVGCVVAIWRSHL